MQVKSGPEHVDHGSATEFRSYNDANMDGPHTDQVPKRAWDPLELSERPIMRGQSKKLKEAFQGLVVRYQERLEEVGVQEGVTKT